MLFILSPAKTLDFSPGPAFAETTAPDAFAKDAAELALAARKLTRADFARLMDLSETLADLTYVRFQAFDPDPKAGTVQAAFAFAGDVYDGLDARRMAPDDLDWAQAHLRILSGLYGLLRPLDAIQPYRLEMGTRLRTRRGATLYDFWGDRIAKALNQIAKDHADPTLVNLASQEYFGAVDAKALKLPLLNIRFLEESEGEAQMISFWAKRARGAMARWAVQKRAEHVETLKRFDLDGYRFDKSSSSERDWVFVRPHPNRAKAAVG